MDYTQHLGAVNTLTFIEQNKFVSSSDDKKLFIWEYGVPVVTRHVSEPEMHTITATGMHPSGQFFEFLEGLGPKLLPAITALAMLVEQILVMTDSFQLQGTKEERFISMTGKPVNLIEFWTGMREPVLVLNGIQVSRQQC